MERHLRTNSISARLPGGYLPGSARHLGGYLNGIGQYPPADIICGKYADSLQANAWVILQVTLA